MDKQTAKKRISKLRDEIRHHRYLYHVENKQQISDAALDSLKKELQDLEDQYPDLVTPDSPTQRVAGQPLDKFEKVEHSQPILSLRDAFNEQDLLDWQKRNQKLLDQEVDFDYYCELKLDGLTVVLTYENGKFVQGATRGNGQVGENVTSNLKTIQAIPLQLRLDKLSQKYNLPDKIEIRGEVLMSKQEFNRLNRHLERQDEETYANPRNLAAGTIRQLDPKVAASRNLDCYAFEIITDCGQKTHQEVHHMLSELGFKTVDHDHYATDMQQVFDYLHTWENKRQQLEFQTDGVVVVVNDLSIAQQLGSVGKAERWMIAYKFPAEQVTTKVKDIQVQVGRVGKLTPVAILEPVQVAGTTVSRASLHNADEIQRLDVRIGDTVIIQKAGDIIPEVVEALTNLRQGNEKKFKMPRKCPVCGDKVVRPEGEVNHYCRNDNCFAVEKEQISHFVSRQGFDIEGLGPKIVEQLINVGLITNAADIFNLQVGDLKPLERFADKSAENLISSIQNSKEISLPKFIHALGIRHVGTETAVTLADYFGDIKSIQQADEQELQQIEDIGEVVAESIQSWFADKTNSQLLDDLFAAGVKIKTYTSAKTQQLQGKKFVFTGSLQDFTRQQAKQAVRQRGGKPVSSISAQTDYVVIGQQPGSKQAQAKKLGVQIIDESQFKKLIK